MNTYELNLTNVTKDKFKAVMKRRLKEKSMTMVDLASQINRPLSTVYNFMYNKNRINRFVAAEIANCLEINREDFA